MRKIFLAFLLLICGNAFAQTYAVDRGEYGVAIINYVEGSNESLEDNLEKLGLSGYPVHPVSELPSTDSKYWAFKDGKIQIDEARKANDVYSRLDVKFIKGNLYKALSPERIIALASYAGLLSDLLEYPNLPGVRDLLNGLQSQGILTDKENFAIKGIFLELQIDLDNLPDGID